MTDDKIIRCIDHLHGLESGSMLQRLHESATFISRDEFDSARAIEAMTADEQKHLRMLVDLLDQLNATPSPRLVDVATGNLHFNKPVVLIPRLIANKDRLIAAFEQAIELLADSPVAMDTVGRILADHRAHRTRLAELRQAVVSG